MIHFRAYRAIDEKELCLSYAEGHRKVLEDFNLSNITTNNQDWMHNPHVYVVVAISGTTGHLLGGIRIQVADGVSALPVEEAVYHFDPNIEKMVRDYRMSGGTSELCGLWNSREEAPNMGITLNLVLAGLSLSNQLPITTMFTIVASYTLKIALQVGFRIEKELGNNGEFIYPNSNYVARVLSMNPLTLANAYSIFQERILFLRENPVCVRLEKVPKGIEIPFDYALKLPNVTEN
jgi:hypothetical protein